MDITIVLTIIFCLMILIGGLIILIYNFKNKKESLDTVLKDIVISVSPAIEQEILQTLDAIDIEDDERYGKDEAEKLSNIETELLNFAQMYGYGKVIELISVMYPKNNKMRKELMSLDKEVIYEYISDVFNSETIQDKLILLFDKCLEQKIDTIESEDRELEKEQDVYESEPEKEECLEDHNKSIDNFIENNNYNSVPVGDPRFLKPFIIDNDIKINPPKEEESETISDDGTIEIISMETEQ